MWTNIVACEIVFSQEDIGSFDFMNNGLAIDFFLCVFMSYYASLVCKWICLQDVQYKFQ